jgi:hypothetical protein
MTARVTERIATTGKSRKLALRRDKASKVGSDSILAPRSAEQWNAWLRSNHALSRHLPSDPEEER